MAGGGPDLLITGLVDAGGADHVNYARLRRQFAERQARLRHSEIDEPLDFGEQRQRVIGDLDAERADAAKFSHVGADRWRTLGLDAAGDLETLGLMHDAGEDAAHAPRSAGNGNLHGTPSTMTTSLSAQVLKILSAEGQPSEVVRLMKDNVSRPAASDIIDELAANCDLVITAIGD